MTDFNHETPIIIGTNLIRECHINAQENETSDIPEAWNMESVRNLNAGIVKVTHRFTLRPYEARTISGIIHKEIPFVSVVTEPCSKFPC